MRDVGGRTKWEKILLTFSLFMCFRIATLDANCAFVVPARRPKRASRIASTSVPLSARALAPIPTALACSAETAALTAALSC